MKSFHKSIWVGSASAIAMLAAAPAFAADGAAGASGKDTAVEEVVVTGIRASLQASIITKRNSNEIVEAITAEDVGKFPDKNVAESLQRISGIAIQREFGEGERVSIRGTAPVLNLTLLNGAPVATADWFVLDQLKASRSFNYLMLPSEIVGQIQVYKSPSAELDEGGIGGTIDVHTRNPLDLPKISVQASAQGVYDSIAGNVDPAGSAMFSWHNDDDTFGALLGLIYSKRAFRRDGIEILGYTDYKTTTDPVTGVVSGGILNANGTRFSASAPNLIGSTLFQQTRERKGANFAIQYAPNTEFKATLTGLYSHMDADNFNQNYMAWPQQMLNAGAAVTNPVLTAPVGTEDLPTMVSGSFTQTTGANGVVFDAIDRIAHTDTGAINFDATWQPSSDWKVHFQTGYTKANGATDQQPFWETNAPTGFAYNVAGGTIPQVHFTDINPQTADQALALGWTSNNTIKNSDDEFYVFGDVEHFFDGSLGPLTSIKVGGKYSSHNRDVDVTYGQTRALFGPTACNGHACSLADVSDGLTPDNFLSGIAGPGTLNSYLMASKDKIEAIYNSLPPFAQWGMPAEGQPDGCGGSLADCQHFGPLESFTLNEKTWGGYAMANFGGQGWGGNAGVRVITTRESSGAWAVGVPSGTPGAVNNPFGLIAPISFEKEYTDVLPSFNIHFDLKDDVVWRFAASRAVARPDYAQMAAFTSLTPLLLTAAGGNPHIDPYRANQFDTSLEWYFAPQSILSIDFFYKDISSYIVQGSSIERLPAEIPSPTDPRLTTAANDCVLQSGDNYICNYTVGRPVNVSGGVDKGIEVSFQKPIWGGFGVIANYTYQDASSQSGVPIPNFSRHLGNLTGYYENDRLSVRISGNYRSKYFADYDSERGFLPLYVGSTFSLDGSVNVNVTENVALTLDAVNLTNETLTERYFDDPNRPARFYKNGRVLYFGVRAKF